MSRISQLTELTTPHDNDLLPIVDVSDTTQASSGSTKYIKVGNLPIQSGVVTDADLQAALADSPELGGVPAAPTAAAGTDTTQIATTAFVAEASESNITRSGASRKRSFVEKMTGVRKPREIYCSFRSDGLKVAFKETQGSLVAYGKSVLFDIRNLDDAFVLYGIYATIQTEDTPVVGRKNLTSRTGTWVDSGGSSYANSNGATATLDFVGTGIVIQHYADQRGGRWSCILDGTGDPFILDTYVPSGGPVVKTKLISGLPFGQHRLICTLQATPNPLNTSGQNRGWMAFSASPGDSSSTFEELGKNVFTIIGNTAIIKDPSNTEFAIAVRPAGTNYSLFFLPSHGTDTVFFMPGESIEVLVDGKVVTQGETAYREVVNYVEMRGKYYGSHPSEPDFEDRLCEIEIVHRFTRDGLTCDVDITWLRECDAAGYSVMSSQGFSSQLETDNGVVVPLPPNANIKLPGAPWVGSILFTKPNGTVDEQSMWMAVDWLQNIDEITRPDDTTNRTVISGQPALQWIAVTGKVYNQVWGGLDVNSIIPAGTRQGWRFKMAAGFF